MDPNNLTEPAVGTIIFSFYWRRLIENILPENSNGMIAVFETSCNQAFTYLINGPTATYIGRGDQHDPKYDYLGESSPLIDLIGQDTMYTGLPLDAEFCPYTVSVYPSQAMEDTYVTEEPVLFTILAAVIFVFTSFLFLTYDFVVARRQRLVKNRALASGAIVDSLFPQNVRHQLYEENEQEQKARAAAERPSYTSNVFRVDAANKTPMDGEKIVGKPIADEFAETTIFFADLAGFTAWNSKRTPVEVFELLEAVYGAFDKIARRRGVFKVETIGDCYVAVTGIPEPQKNHAVIMCRFARECMMSMSQVTNDLVDSLGADTRDLEMRIGLHSGSTTAGVLRGDKGRFQLFGDTVNTASRMESNGVKGRIQVSQATANKLIEAGKGSWLTAREDKIVAKGKGEMQTYWVTFDGTRSVVSSAMTPTVRSHDEWTTDDEGNSNCDDSEDQAPQNLADVVEV